MKYEKRVKVAFAVLILLGFVFGAIMGASISLGSKIQRSAEDLIKQTQQTGVYPATCDETAKSVLISLGGCSIVDCKLYNNICEACCPDIGVRLPAGLLGNT